MFINEKSEKNRAINKRLMDVCDAKEKKILNTTIRVNGLSFVKLRDILIEIGKIHLEDIEANIYIAVIPGGFARMNYAVVAFQLLEDELIIAAYANEGIINQHTSEGVVDEFRKYIGQYIEN